MRKSAMRRYFRKFKHVAGLGITVVLLAASSAVLSAAEVSAAGVSTVEPPSGFGPKHSWSDSLCANGETCLLGDVNGDGRADAVTFVKSTAGGDLFGDVYVALSEAHRFKANQKWSDLMCTGDEECALGDVNGDGKADAVAFVKTPGNVYDGDVYVALSTGSGFGGAQKWSDWLCLEGQACGLADVNGDRRADAVAFVKSTVGDLFGDVYVALSNGSSFGGNQKWSDLLCIKDENCALGDVNGDGKADAVAFVKNAGNMDGDVYVALSTGSGFGGAQKWSDWLCLEGEACGLADVNGDRRADAVAFVKSTVGDLFGDVYVALSNGSSFDGNQKWSDVMCVEDEQCALGDVNGDRRADAVAFVNSTQPEPARGDVSVGLTFGPFGPVDAPGRHERLEAAAKSVTVRWFDRSDNETIFVVQKRDTHDNWFDAFTTPTRDSRGGGWTDGQYSWTDTDTTMSAQCYRVVARNGSGSFNDGIAGEQCTVRPDPDRFPVVVTTTWGRQWSRFTHVEWLRGGLYNSDRAEARSLGAGNQTWGVDLDWYVDAPNDWLFFGSGGSGGKVMMGQAVAIRVYGGLYLKYGKQTFGINLELSPTPAYEWYIIGTEGDLTDSAHAGENPANGSHALWNSTAGKYLVSGNQTFGIDLTWYDPEAQDPPPPPPPTAAGVKTIKLYNCMWPDSRNVAVWVLDAMAGTGWTQVGDSLGPQWTSSGTCGPNGYAGQPWTFNPIHGHNYWIRTIDYDAPGCENVPDYGCWRLEIRNMVGNSNGVIRHDISG